MHHSPVHTSIPQGYQTSCEKHFNKSCRALLPPHRASCRFCPREISSQGDFIWKVYCSEQPKQGSSPQPSRPKITGSFSSRNSLSISWVLPSWLLLCLNFPAAWTSAAQSTHAWAPSSSWDTVRLPHTCTSRDEPLVGSVGLSSQDQKILWINKGNNKVAKVTLRVCRHTCLALGGI